MIKKIHNIRGVGRFKDFESKHGIDLDKLTLIYAENGQGKSTLADILRSLAEGDSRRINGRLTVGENNQFVKLDTADDVRCFHNGRWNKSYSDIHVFDEVFISENVYDGLHVSPPQRANLHSIIVGEELIRAKQQEDKIVEERKQLRALRDEAKAQILSAIQSMFSRSSPTIDLDDFIALEQFQDIDARVSEQERVVSELAGHQRILDTPEFVPVDVYSEFEDDYRALLTKDLSGIADDALSALEEHASCFPGQELNDWLGRGTQYRSEPDGTCPYCGQSLHGISLIQHYQSIFSKSFEAFQSEVASFSERLDPKDWISRARFNHQLNLERQRSWVDNFPDMDCPVFNLDALAETLQETAAALTHRLELKQKSLFKTVEVGEGAENALRVLDKFREQIKIYNAAIAVNNQRILDLRKRTEEGNLSFEQNGLNLLRCHKLRYHDELRSACDKYQHYKSQAHEKNTVLERHKKQSDRLKESVIEQFGKRLNYYLVKFGAQFEVAELDESRHGAMLRAEYKLRLVDDALQTDGQTIDLGNPGIDFGMRSFRNFLSEGDRRTLALAFFLASLDKMSDLSKKTLVFDDPVSSLDDTRRGKTILEIGRLAKEAGQVIVLSHRKLLLHSLWDRFGYKRANGVSTARLHLRSKRHQRPFESWDSESDIASDDAKRRRRVLEFLAGNTSRDIDEISGELRPLLGYHYKVTYPFLVKQYNLHTLGDIVQILDSNSNDQLIQQLSKCDKPLLSGLNIIHRESHHGHDPPPEPLTESELTADCKTVMRLLGRRDYGSKL